MPPPRIASTTSFFINGYPACAPEPNFWGRICTQSQSLPYSPCLSLPMEQLMYAHFHFTLLSSHKSRSKMIRSDCLLIDWHYVTNKNRVQEIPPDCCHSSIQFNCQILLCSQKFVWIDISMLGAVYTRWHLSDVEFGKE